MRVLSLASFRHGSSKDSLATTLRNFIPQTSSCKINSGADHIWLTLYGLADFRTKLGCFHTGTLEIS